jgi:hypothetical protein
MHVSEQVEAKREEYLEKRKRAKEAPSTSSAKTQMLPANGNHVPDEEDAVEEEDDEEKVEVEGDSGVANAEVDSAAVGQENGEVEEAADPTPARVSDKGEYCCSWCAAV